MRTAATAIVVMAMPSVPVGMARAAAVTACTALAWIVFRAMAFARAGASSGTASTLAATTTASTDATTASAGATTASTAGAPVAVKSSHTSGDYG